MPPIVLQVRTRVYPPTRWLFAEPGRGQLMLRKRGHTRPCALLHAGYSVTRFPVFLPRSLRRTREELGCSDQPQAVCVAINLRIVEDALRERHQRVQPWAINCSHRFLGATAVRPAHVGQMDTRVEGAQAGQVRKRWIDKAVSARIWPIPTDRPSRRVLGALLAVPKNGCQIARDRVWVESGHPPMECFRHGRYLTRPAIRMT